MLLVSHTKLYLMMTVKNQYMAVFFSFSFALKYLDNIYIYILMVWRSESVKKIFLCLLCGVLLLGVTGCGNEKESKKNDNTPKENTEGIAVTDVYATSNNYLVVKADGKVYIIDNEGKKQGTLDISIDEKNTITINDDGYVYYGNYGNNNIYDKTGKIVLESTDDITYQYISANNNTIRRSKDSDFETGTTTVKEIVDMEGEAIKKLDAEVDQYYVGGNIWQIYDEEGEFLYNEETNEKLENEDYFDDYSYYYGGPDSATAITIANGGVFFDEHHFVTSDLKYTYDEDIIYVSSDYYYNNEDYSIYSYPHTIFVLNKQTTYYPNLTEFRPYFVNHFPVLIKSHNLG